MLRFILFLIILFSLIYLVWKITPAYLQNYELTKSIESVSQNKIINPNMTLETNQENVVNYLARSFRVNDMQIPLAAIKLRKESTQYEVDVDYEVREHLIGNMDIIMTFSNHLKV